MREAIEKLIKERAMYLQRGDRDIADSIEIMLKRFNVTLTDSEHGTRYMVG